MYTQRTLILTTAFRFKEIDMNGVVMGNVAPLKAKIKELESENARLKALLQDIQRPTRDEDFDDWYFDFKDYVTYD